MLTQLLCIFVALSLRYRYKTFSRRSIGVSKSEKISSDLANPLSVIGSTQNVNSSSHPVISLILERWRNESKPGHRYEHDTRHISLAIEGGGMRGCVAAGAAGAIHFLGLSDCFDSVYGSSAGAMVGSYFVSRQFAGTQIYHDTLPAAGKSFINKLNLLRAIGLPPARWPIGLGKRFLKNQLSNFRRKSNKDIPSNIQTTPLSSRRVVINLDYLLAQVMDCNQRLDWEAFVINDSHQPLHIIATDLHSMKPISLCSKNNNFIPDKSGLQSLLTCIRASMSVPGATGELVTLENIRSVPHYSAHNNQSIYSSSSNHSSRFASRWRRRTLMQLRLILRSRRNRQHLRHESKRETNKEESREENKTAKTDAKRVLAEEDKSQRQGDKPNARAVQGMEKSPSQNSLHAQQPSSTRTVLADAFLCEPMPYRSAVANGATDVVVLRTRPDPCTFRDTGPGVFERLICGRFFRVRGEKVAEAWTMGMKHHHIYMQDVLTLNEAARGDAAGVQVGDRRVHILPIAPGAAYSEVSQLEMSRARVLDGMRGGAERVFELFAPGLGLSTEDFSPSVLAEILFPADLSPPYKPIEGIEEETVSHGRALL